MATTQDRKPSNRRSAGGTTPPKSSAKKSATTTQKRSSTRTNTLAERNPAVKSKQSRAGQKDVSKKAPQSPAPHDDAQETAKIARRRTFSEQFMPYILGAIALFLGVCFVCDAIGHATTPAEHLMGFVGYYICYVLFGLFGWPIYLSPLLIVHLAIFWKRYCERRLVALKVTLSVLLGILLSTYIHVGMCSSNPALAEVYDPGYLFRTGAALESGGLVGGLLGYVCYLGLRLPGTIVLAVITLPLLIMGLVGVTPGYVFSKLWAAIQVARARQMEKQRVRAEAEPEDEDTESYEADEDAEASAPTESYRARRAREAVETATKPSKSATHRTVVVEGETVDEETGEILSPASESDKGRGKKRKKSGATADTARTTEAVEAEQLDLFSTEDESDMARDGDATDVTAKAAASGRSVMADGELAWEEFASDDGTETTSIIRMTRPSEMDVSAIAAEERPEVIGDEETVDLDDEDSLSDVTEAKPASTVSYAVVTDGGESLTAPPDDNRQINVVIHKQDTTAVMAEGLADEEVVIPTTTADAPVEPAKEYLFPPIEMLTRGPNRYETNDAEIAENTQQLREVLESFRIGVREISCSCGPTITRFEVKPDSGIRVRSIVNLVDDISMGMAKAGVRIEAPIPGKSAVGIEVPNSSPAMVYLRNILETPEFRNHKSRIASCLGADVGGRPVIFDIQTMPHLLIAGATGTGKSVCINSIIMSILYKADPADVKLILIDPKKVEFAMYRDLPHLYAPVVSDPKKAAGALNSAVNEMERRFELIEEVGVRNLAGYNKITEGDPERPPLPQMVIIIDELADLMMTAPAEVETAICRLAQKARAAGIHLVVGTQRPSVDVITGLIKANIPSRIAFAVSSAIDSKIILETTGADKLIGRGDMLFSPLGTNKPIRVQGAFVSETEVEQVVTFIKEHNEKGTFNEDFTREIELEAAKCGTGKRRAGEQMSIEECDALGVSASNEDPKFWEALEVAVGQEKIGTSALQRKLNLGYGRAAKIIDRMEELGFVGPDPGTKQGRKVIITANELAEYRMNGLPGSWSDHEDE